MIHHVKIDAANINNAILWLSEHLPFKSTLYDDFPDDPEAIWDCCLRFETGPRWIFRIKDHTELVIWFKLVWA